MSIYNVLKAGDTVYLAANGQPIKVDAVYSSGFKSDKKYYSFDQHRKLFWLTKVGYLDSVKRSDNNGE